MGSFCALGTVTGISQTVLILPTLEEFFSFYRTLQFREVTLSGHLPRSANYEVPAPSTALQVPPACPDVAKSEQPELPYSVPYQNRAAPMLFG